MKTLVKIFRKILAVFIGVDRTIEKQFPIRGCCPQVFVLVLHGILQCALLIGCDDLLLFGGIVERLDITRIGTRTIQGTVDVEGVLV